MFTKPVIFIQTLILAFFVFLPSSHASGDFHIFQPISADSSAKTEDWTAQGVPESAAQALAAYQQKPGMDTAIGVLKHYNTFADQSMDAVRRDLFTNHPKIFQSLDAAKYELILKTQQNLPELDYSFRVGSTGARFMEWVKWARNPLRSPDNMPALNPNKQFKSDDDVTNVASKAAVQKNPLASELINGETARDTFKQMTKKLYGVELDPKEMQVEFLSPTSAYKVMHAKRPGEFTGKWPAFMQAWFSADPEKYNGMYGVEQLHEWGMKAGYVTEDAASPTQTTGTYADFHNLQTGRGFPSMPDDDLFGWVANNHRQIFQVHKGDLKSLAKYTMRDIDAWKKLGLDPPVSNNLSVEDIEVMAEMIYKPENAGQMKHAQNIERTAYDILFEYNRKLLIEAHKHHTQALVDKLKTLAPPRPSSPDEPVDPGAYLRQANEDPEVQKLMDNLAVGYTNLDTDTLKKITSELEETINLGRPADLETDVPWDDAMKAEFGAHVKTLLSDVQDAAAVTRKDIEAFRFMRYSLGTQLNEHLTRLAGLNLDDYLVKIASGDVTVTEYRWTGWRPRSVKRVLSPEEIAADMRLIHTMSEQFAWGDEKFAKIVKDYFAGDPPAAVGILKKLHAIYDPELMRPVTFKYKDSQGNEVIKQIHPSRWESVRSVGVLMFKGALKGWKIWGDAADGRDLFKNLHSIYWDNSLTAEQIAKGQAKALSSFIGVSEYLELVNVYGKSTVKTGVWAGGTLANLAQLSDGGYFDPQQQKDFAYNLIKDITTAYIPQLAVANTVWGIASYGYDKWSLSASKAEIIDFLVENGEWKIEKKKVTDSDGNEIEVADRTKLPELLNVRYTADGETINETVAVRKFKKKDQDMWSVPRLAKVLDAQKYPNGIKLMKTGTFVKPREALLDVAYRDSKGYISNHPMLSITETAVRELIDDYWFQFSIYWTTTRSWTADWVEGFMDVKILIPEDSRPEDVRRIYDQSKGDAASGPFVLKSKGSSWFGMREFLWEDWVKTGVRKNFAHLVIDYLSRRQVILEDDILPALVEQAARRVMKDDIAGDPSGYLREIGLMDERMMEVDKRVWPKIARSADPFPPTRDYDAETDIPITERFRFVTQQERADIKRIIQWVDNSDPAKDPLEIWRTVPGTDGPTQEVSYIEDADEARKQAGQVIKTMTEILYKFEEVYEKILQTGESVSSYVASSEGVPGFKIEPFHLSVSGTGGRVSDAKLSEAWDKSYREQEVKAERDVGNILNKRGWEKLGQWETFIGDWTGTGFEFYAARSHPYWGKLLRLRFQIQKLGLVLANLNDVTETEVRKVFSDGVMLLEDKPIDVDLPPTHLTPLKNEDDSADPAAGVPAAAAPQAVSLGLGTPAEREVFLKKMIELMEAEYQRLLGQILNMFDMELEIHPAAPAGDFSAWSVMEASVTHKAKKGQISQSKINSVIKKYKWIIHRRDQSVYIEKETKDPVVKIPLFEGREAPQGAQAGAGAAMLLRVQALGASDIPLAEQTLAFPVKPARFKGSLKIWGDWEGHAPVMIQADARMLDAVDVPSGTDVEFALDFAIEKAPRLDKLDTEDLDNKFYVDFQSHAWVDINPKARSEGVTGQTSPGLFSLPGDKALELFYPYNVEVFLEVKDASGVKVNERIEKTVKSGTQRLTDPPSAVPYVLKLYQDDEVFAQAAHSRLKGIEKTEGPQRFDREQGKTLDFEVRLPYFAENNLTVRGTFVTADGIEPPVRFVDGQLRSNIRETGVVGSAGEFSFTNEQDIPLSEPLEIEAVLYSSDGRMLIPGGGIYTEPLREGPEMIVGPIACELHKVIAKPIPIQVTDWAGMPIPSDRLSVTVGGRPASQNGNLFEGAWEFERRGEEVEVKAEMDLGGGKKAAGKAMLSVDAFELMKKGPQTLAQPVEVKVRVYQKLAAFGATEIRDVPDGKEAPTKVKLRSAAHNVDEFTDAGAVFEFPINMPVSLDETITLSALARKVGIDYEGTAAAKPPLQPQRLAGSPSVRVDFGTIVLKPGKQKGFVTLKNLNVSGEGGRGIPQAGKGMVITAAADSADYDGPLEVRWERLSDGAKKIDTARVTPGGHVDLSADLSAVPKAMQTRDDMITLTVTDGGSESVTEKRPFTWEEIDEFQNMRLYHMKNNRLGASFELGEKIGVTSKWKIVKDSKPERFISYLVDSAVQGGEPVTVKPGGTFEHDMVINTKGLQPGRIEVTAMLDNPDNATTALGSKKFTLKKGTDEILRAWVSVAQGNQSEGRNFNQGGPVYLMVWVKAHEGFDGQRTITVEFKGKPVMAETFDLKAGDSAEKSFQINTGKLDPGQYRLTAVLTNTDEGKQDQEIIRFEIKEGPQAPPSRNTGGMQDVFCTGDAVTLKVWDHASQDGDIISLKLGQSIVLSGFNMGDEKNQIAGCGGPGEPGGGPCVFTNLPLPPGTQVPVSVFAHNEGSSSPNTASLKVMGGCTPELQNWSLSEGSSATIMLSRV